MLFRSDSIESAEIEMKRFFREGEIFEARKLFPAHAGVTLCSGQTSPSTNTFPRKRGGDPEWFRDQNIDNPFSPHTRG